MLSLSSVDDRLFPRCKAQNLQFKAHPAVMIYLLRSSLILLILDKLKKSCNFASFVAFDKND